jgi:8-amino-7-oxononanoate synthase
MQSFLDDIRADLAELKSSGNYRRLREIAPEGEGRSRYDGRVLCNLSSNDYLGLAGDSALREEFYRQYNGDWRTPELALSSASSRLLTGNTPAYARLEATLSELYGGRAALVFNSGYHANIGILPALAKAGDLVISDKLNHASIIDGLRLGGAEFLRYPHLALDRLEATLAARRHKYKRVFVVTESIFSMDGDTVDLRQLVALKERYGCALVVDEAHAVGVRGPKGAGFCAEQGVAERVDVLIGTFGKALGSTGAYAIMAPELREYLINHMRPLIFTTGLPPVVLNWSRFALQRCATMDRERAELKRLAMLLRGWLHEVGREQPGDTQIVPYVIGDADAALVTARRFQEHGFLVFAIRPPTVPAGTSRLRFSLSAALRTEDLAPIRELL